MPYLRRRCPVFTFSLDRAQRRLRGLVGDGLFSNNQPLSHKRKVASLSLLCYYFYGKCSGQFHPLIPSVETLSSGTHCYFYHQKNDHPYSIGMPEFRLWRYLCLQNWYIVALTDVWRSRVVCNLNFIKSRANHYLSWYSLFPSRSTYRFLHSLTLYQEWLLGLTLSDV